MKYINEIKDIVAEQAYEQLKHNLECVDTKELGEVIDMVKDMAEAAYYCSVVEAMEDNWDREAKEEYMERKYAGSRSVATPYQDGWERDTGRRTRHLPYYDYDEPVARDIREGRSPLTRKMYMEAKTQHQGKEVQLHELEKYMGELSSDVTEMISDATIEEKQMLHNKLLALASKIETLMR